MSDHRCTYSPSNRRACQLAEELLSRHLAAETDPDPDGCVVYVTGDTGEACHDFAPGTEVVVEANEEDDYTVDGMYLCVATDDESVFAWVSAVDLDVEPPRLPVGTRVRVVEAPYLDVPEDLADTGAEGTVVVNDQACGAHTCYGVDLEGDGFVTVYATKVQPIEAEPPRRELRLGDRVRIPYTDDHVGFVVYMGGGFAEVLCPDNPLPHGLAVFPGAGTYLPEDLTRV